MASETGSTEDQAPEKIDGSTHQVGHGSMVASWIASVLHSGLSGPGLSASQVRV